MNNGDDNLIEKDDVWALLQAFFEEKGLVRQHLDSYNDFIDNQLQEIVDEIGEVLPDIPGFKIRFGKIKVDIPQIREADGALKEITPYQARVRDLTYAADIMLEMIAINIDERTQIQQEEEPEWIFIGKMPIMLKSKKCPLSHKNSEQIIADGEDPIDAGGYFIINGTERVLVTQEDLAPNTILIDEASSSSSSTHIAKVFSTTKGFRAPVTIERRKDGTLRVSFPSVPGKIPFAVLMRALGLRSDREIINAVSDNDEIARAMLPVVEVAASLNITKDLKKSQENALDYIGKRVAVGQTRKFRIQRAEQVLDKYLLPHIGDQPEDRIKKAYYLGQMAQKVFDLTLDNRKPDDKDHYANKRLKLAGDLFASLFRVAFSNLCRDIKYQLERTAVRGRKPSIKTAVRADVITERIRHALATGNWVGGKAGVSQLLDRNNYIASLSHLRRIISPLSRSQPHFEARDLHPTQWGKICPAETPEGPNCGLVKNFALSAYVSIGYDERKLEMMLNDFGLIPIQKVRDEKLKGTNIFLNGRLIGIHEDADDFVRKVREERRKGLISDQVNIGYRRYANEVQINSDAGRSRRPLFIVENGKLLIEQYHIKKIRSKEWEWSDLIRPNEIERKRGKIAVIEYLDAEEEENAYIAIYPEDITPEHSHCEITPAAILGITASLIPFPERNQSPRNTYEAGMAKQALGIFSSNFHLRLDTRGHTLHYPQIPLVGTKPMDIIGFEKRPAGQNFVVAVLSYAGYNIEDALIINKASIERGLARSTFFRTYDSEERRYPGGQEDKFQVPEHTVRGYKPQECYRHLSEDGLIEPETQVEGGDVLIGRTSPPRFIEEYKEFDMPTLNRRETSIPMRHGEKGIVDTVILTETKDGNRLVKVKVRDQRIPELGDKFASRHGQKGIIGLIIPQEDMPFTEDGIVPDLLINPHAIPSRMTLGQMMETVAGKIAAFTGRKVDSTAFSLRNPDDLQQVLLDLGFEYNGRQTMYNGITGEKYEIGIFIGCVYYQKLHHLVADKMHARARGPVQILTRQPTEGRAREGGLRFGEMERDCLVGHGASLLLKERLLDESDKTTINVCEKCGLLATYDKKQDKYYCSICGDKSTISQVECSYAFKLLIQEMMALGLAPRLRLEEKA
ncbi:MAG: DNA-directed RNA polymerase subunit B [Promethearchaeota archaeon]